MPLLARLVIGLAMLTSGWVNCFGEIEIRGAIATDLINLNIAVETQANGETDIYSTDSDRVQHTTRGANRIIWLIHSRWPEIGTWSSIIGWAAAIIQLLSGVLLVVGLFTRWAAFLVCIASGGAIYLVAFAMHGMFFINPFDWPLDSHRFLQLFAGLSIFTLALGVLFSGAGQIGIDSRHQKIQAHTDKESNS